VQKPDLTVIMLNKERLPMPGAGAGIVKIHFHTGHIQGAGS